MAEDQEDESQQEKPDPNVYQPDQESDDIEIDRRIRRANERLKRMTMVGFPQINETFGCQDTLHVEGGFETGWAINYIDCGKQHVREGPPPPIILTGACCSGASFASTCTITTEAECIELMGGHYEGDGTVCEDFNCDQGACCTTGGSCFDTFDFFCGDCSPGHSCFQGLGTTCANSRCEGSCCVACAADCDSPTAVNLTCLSNATFDECAFAAGSCTPAWLLNGPGCNDTIFPTPAGSGDYCCQAFSGIPSDRCYPSGNCCCSPGGICGSAISEEDCATICDPSTESFWQGFLPLEQQCLCTGINPC